MIADDRIARATFVATKNVTPGHAVKPLYLVFYDYAEEDVAGLLGNDACVKRSMHLLVNTAGKATQLAPFTTKTWHAGQSYWQGHHGLNSYGIGIALEKPNTDAQFKWLDWAVPELVVEYNIRDIVRHCDVRPGSLDGFNFPIDRYKPYVEYGNAESLGKYVVSVPTKALNVRGGPGVLYSVIDELQTGDSVKVLRASQEAPDWLFISYSLEGSGSRQGWVHESFLRRA